MNSKTSLEKAFSVSDVFGIPGVDALRRYAVGAPGRCWYQGEVEGVRVAVLTLYGAPGQYAVASESRVPRFLTASSPEEAAIGAVCEGCGFDEEGRVVSSARDQAWQDRVSCSCCEA